MWIFENNGALKLKNDWNLNETIKLDPLGKVFPGDRRVRARLSEIRNSRGEQNEWLGEP